MCTAAVSLMQLFRQRIGPGRGKKCSFCGLTIIALIFLAAATAAAYPFT
jgi:hypothetical protein